MCREWLAMVGGELVGSQWGVSGESVMSVSDLAANTDPIEPTDAPPTPAGSEPRAPPGTVSPPEADDSADGPAEAGDKAVTKPWGAAWL